MATSRRERELARARYQRVLEKQAAAAAARRRRRRWLTGVAAGLAAILVVVVVALSLSGNSKTVTATTPTVTPTTTPSPTSTGPRKAHCTASSAKPVQKKFGAPAMTLDTKASYTATMVTTCGTITFSLDAAKAPQTVNSLAFLAGKGYFTNTPCHRVSTTDPFILQCGDPTGTGSGSPGYTLPEENLPKAPAGSTEYSYPAGTVAMARTSAKHSGGSQFFLVYKASPLPPDYTVFGQITSGLDILAAIGTDGATTPPDGAPVDPVVVTSLTVTKKA